MRISQNRAIANPGRRDAAEQRLAAWFDGAGRALLDAEREPLGEAVRRFHGDVLLWLGATSALIDTTARCLVRTRMHACRNPVRGAGAPEAGRIAADAAALPFASGSVDGVVLHHALEVAGEPQRVLREATRVLRPGGRLLALGFNPASLWLLARVRRPFRSLKPVSVPRIYDWLSGAGLERCDATLYLRYRGALPFVLSAAHWRRASAWLAAHRLPVGGVYLVSAAKRDRAFSGLQREAQAAGRRAAPAPLPNPTRQAA